MLNPDTRKRIQNLCRQIELGESVSLTDAIYLEKWASANRSVRDWLNKARAIAINGTPAAGSMDEFLQDLGVGDPDPTRHLDCNSTIDDLADFFRSSNDGDERRLRRD